MELTPLAPQNSRVIRAYGDGGFRVGEERIEGSIIITSSEIYPWSVTRFSDLDRNSLAPLHELDPKPDVILIGCGASIRFLPHALRHGLRDAGLSIDVMDTGAACRTFNVLLSEERRVAAALIAV